MKRREFLKTSCRCAALLGVGGAGVALAMKKRTSADGFVWQIDPNKCTACGLCANNCVLNISAAKCFHNFAMCGYCELCTGYFLPEADLSSLHTGADMQLCPTSAISRSHIEGPSFEYNIDKSLCVGCGLCVEGCTAFGNGSLYLQIDQEVCLQCNQCAIAAVCPSGAINLVKGTAPYIL
ncbi:MAG: 4Fe-4S binding protein, partial [Thermoguttaceae bacterium]